MRFLEKGSLAIHKDEYLNSNFTKSEKFTKTEKKKEEVEMEEKKQIRWWIGKVALFVERIRNSFNRRKRIWWHGDGRQGAVPTTQNLKLIAPVYGKELKKFIAKELKESEQFFGRMPFFPSLAIIVAGIEARRKEYERLRSAKEARFLQYIRGMKKNDKNI